MTDAALHDAIIRRDITVVLTKLLGKECHVSMSTVECGKTMTCVIRRASHLLVYNVTYLPSNKKSHAMHP